MLVCDWSASKPYYIGPVFFERIHRGFLQYVPAVRKKNIKIACQLISDSEMKRLNSMWRGVRSTTDVLSFPYTETMTPRHSVEDTIWYDGEVFLCIDQARRQANTIGHSIRVELAHLYTHGVLHILGYDHATSMQAKKMYSLQNKIVNTYFLKK